MLFKVLLLSAVCLFQASFSMNVLEEKPCIKVVEFKLSENQEEYKSIIKTICYADFESGYLQSGDTGIFYNLSVDQMKVIQKNYSAVSFSRSLQNDYLMKTTVHSDSDNYVRVTINDNNYESKNSTDIANRWYDTIEKKKKSEQIDSIPFSLHTKKLVLPKHSKIIGLSVNDSYSRQKNYVCGKIEANTLTLDSDKPYNNEGFCYEGTIELDDSFVQQMTKNMNYWRTSECFCVVSLRESPKIIINILAQRPVKVVLAPEVKVVSSTAVKSIDFETVKKEVKMSPHEIECADQGIEKEDITETETSSQKLQEAQHTDEAKYDAKEKKTVVLSNNGWHRKIFLCGSALMLCIIATVYLYKSSHA